jgi:hypothetical protein
VTDAQAILISASILIAPHMSKSLAAFTWLWAFAIIVQQSGAVSRFVEWWNA